VTVFVPLNVLRISPIRACNRDVVWLRHTSPQSDPALVCKKIPCRDVPPHGRAPGLDRCGPAQWTRRVI